MRGKFSNNETHQTLLHRFNEARAQCAGSCSTRRSSWSPPTRFNEARAQCAGSCHLPRIPVASLRGFNEARAQCAGSSPPARRRPRRGRRFNEARAQCAGSWRPGAAARRGREASMRPAHSAREVGHQLAHHGAVAHASMRPAHSAREVRHRRNPHHKQLVGGHCESLALLPNLVQSQAVDGTDSSP